MLSVIIPTFNEERSIGKTLDALQHAGVLEIIVVDGGSTDATVDIVRSKNARLLTAPRGRGIQMHAGAELARAPVLMFLHADTLVPPDATLRVQTALEAQAGVGGNFDVHFDGNSRAARFLTWLYPRLGKIGLCYGDSAIFVRSSVYHEVGGFKQIPLFEDLDLVRRLKKHGRMVHLPLNVVTSSRRFEGRSFPLTFARWSVLQGLYWLGISPQILSRLYSPVRGMRS